MVRALQENPPPFLGRHVINSTLREACLHSCPLSFSNEMFLQVLLLLWTLVIAFPRAIHNHTSLSEPNWSMEKFNMIYSRSNLKSVEKPLIPPWAAEGFWVLGHTAGRSFNFSLLFSKFPWVFKSSSCWQDRRKQLLTDVINTAQFHTPRPITHANSFLTYAFKSLLKTLYNWLKYIHEWEEV